MDDDLFIDSHQSPSRGKWQDLSMVAIGSRPPRVRRRDQAQKPAPQPRQETHRASEPVLPSPDADVEIRPPSVEVPVEEIETCEAGRPARFLNEGTRGRTHPRGASLRPYLSVGSPRHPCLFSHTPSMLHPVAQCEELPSIPPSVEQRGGGTTPCLGVDGLQGEVTATLDRVAGRTTSDWLGTEEPRVVPPDP
jgi:hypothetical protein